MKLYSGGAILGIVLLFFGGFLGVAVESGEFEQSIHVKNGFEGYIFGPLKSGDLESRYWILPEVGLQAATMLFKYAPGCQWRTRCGYVEVLMEDHKGNQSWEAIGCDETGQWLYLGCEVECPVLTAQCLTEEIVREAMEMFPFKAGFDGKTAWEVLK